MSFLRNKIMAGSGYLNIVGAVTGLGEPIQIAARGEVVTTPTKVVKLRQIQAVADTEEALNMGGVSTPSLVIVECVSNDVDIDTSFVAAFAAELTVEEGGPPAVIPTPSGTVYVKNNDAGESFTIDVTIVGT